MQYTITSNVPSLTILTTSQRIS